MKISILILRCANYLRGTGMLHTVEIISAVRCTPRRWSLWYVAHHEDHLRSVLHIAEIVSTVCCSLRRQTTMWSNISTKSKPNTLACLLGAQMGLNHEKIWRSKISCPTPFKEGLAAWFNWGYSHFVWMDYIVVAPGYRSQECAATVRKNLWSSVHCGK